MSQDLRSAIVRIKTADDIVVGAGFLVAERTILTCIHVVSAALKRSVQTIPSDPIHLDFPLVAPEQTLTASAIYWKSKQPNRTGDIAGLKIIGPLPIGVQPVNLTLATETWEHSFRAFGFPPNHDDGVWTSGVLRDKKANGHIQIEDVKIAGFPVGPGFSGAPVWDEELRAVVGMVVTAERKAEVKAAFMIPTDELLEVVPVFDEGVGVRSELAALQVTTNQALQHLLQGEKPVPQIADDLLETTRQIEKIAAILQERFTQQTTSPYHIRQLHYVTEMMRTNQAIILAVRQILRPLRRDNRFQHQATLVTQLNKLIDCLTQLQNLLI